MKNPAILEKTLLNLQAFREQVRASGRTPQAYEAELERILDEIYLLATEVSLTSMPSQQGLSCKARYLLEYLEPEGGDITNELARSLATDVITATRASKTTH